MNIEINEQEQKLLLEMMALMQFKINIAQVVLDLNKKIKEAR